MPISGPRRVELACVALLVTSVLLATVADGQTYRIDPDHSIAEFSVVHFGILREQGQFRRASGTIVVDPAGVAGGSIGVVIDLASVDTGWDLRDDFLRGPSMFDVAHYPRIRFRSHHLEYRDHRVVAAEGNITLHGVTRPLRLEVNDLVCGRIAADGREGCDATVTGRLKRREFGISFAYPLVGDDVDLEFTIAAFRVGDEAETESP